MLEEDEELTPSLENMVVLMWLQLIHKDLPRLVKQRYGTELRSRTLASIKPEISQALSSLLDEVHTTEGIRVMRAAPSSSRQYGSFQRRFQAGKQRALCAMKTCPLCKQAGRQEVEHFLSTCKYLPEADRKFMVKARLIASVDDIPSDDEYAEDPCPNEHDEPIPVPVMRRVEVKHSPYMKLFYQHHPVCVTIDSGAETNMVRESIAQYVGAHITKSSQSALQADGQSPLEVVGETRMTITRWQEIHT